MFLIADALADKLDSRTIRPKSGICLGFQANATLRVFGVEMLSVVDVFSGCGGFSLGAHQAGFRTALAIDSDPILSSSFEWNFRGSRMLRVDVRAIDASVVRSVLPQGVDGLIGGPPCQPFSEIGRKDFMDPRRGLVAEFFRLVRLARPKFFVFENVKGLVFEKNIALLKTQLADLPQSWSVFGPVVLNAADFGAPTRRLRMFVFGFDRDRCNPPDETALLASEGIATNVREAISDLVTASSVGFNDRGFDVWRYDRRRAVPAYARGLRSRSGTFTSHRLTTHTESTLRRFRALAPGGVDKIGKYVRLSWDGLCPTLRAGTGNDRGSYQAVRPVHPELDRVITPREAARLQGFPDGFRFHPTVWHSCRMIGNSVSPPMARILMSRIAAALGHRHPTSIDRAAEG